MDKRKKTHWRRSRLCFLLLLLAGLPGVSRAELYSFTHVSYNHAGDPEIGEAQLSLLVSKVGEDPTRVRFEFSNAVGAPCSLTDIYFYDGVLVNFTSVSLDPSSGVNFPNNGAKPAHLPGYGIDGTGLSGVVFSADSEGARVANGVDVATEWVAAIFVLQPGKTFDQVISGLESRQIVIGAKVQGFSSGGSESFINDQTPVPVPGAVLLGMLGLSAAGVRLRRFV